MVKYGIIADTHIDSRKDPLVIQSLIEQLIKAFKDVDEIIHVGDICEQLFLDELDKIAPTKCVQGHEDKIDGLPEFIKFSEGEYNIGIIHIQPESLEDFFKKNDLHILIFGHTHQPLIRGTSYNTLLINPGSPVEPKAPPQKKGFEKPSPRPTVITLNIDKSGILSTFLITLNINEKLEIK